MLKKIAFIRKNLFEKFAISLKRFTEPLLLAASAVVISIILNHTNYQDSSIRDTLTRVAMTLALGVPLFLSIRVFFERFPFSKGIVKMSCKFIGVAGLILYYFFLLKDFKMVSFTRYAAVSIALYLVFLFVPYFFKRERFELYVVKLFTAFTVTYLYSVVLYLGLAAIIFTVNKLFGLGTNHLYFDFWLMVAGVFAPAYFLAGIPEYGQDLPEDYYPKVLKILLLYIVMPMIVAYAAILYIYFAKIIISRVWPAGIVSHLVLWYSLISVSVICFIDPLKNSNRWCAKFIFFFPRFVLPLLVMMFLSLGIRIQAYGITENRYFVFSAGLWVTGCTAYYLLSKKPRNIVLPVTAALIAVLSVTGPWSCYTVSKFSQNYRLAAILTKYHMLKDNTIHKPSRELPPPAKREISSILAYFQQNHRLKDIGYLPKNFKIKDMNAVFGFKFNGGYGRFNNSSYFSYAFMDGKVQNIKGYEYFVKLSKGYPEVNKNDKEMIYRERDLVFSYDREGVFGISKQGQVIYSQNVSSLTAKIVKRYQNNLKLMKKLTYPDRTDKVNVLYAFDNIRGFVDNATGEYQINYFNCYLFIRIDRE